MALFNYWAGIGPKNFEIENAHIPSSRLIRVSLLGHLKK